MASKVEGFPNSMVEAMACGVPVVAADCPGECGDIIGKKDSGSIVSDIEFLDYGILTPHISGKIKMNSKTSDEEILLGRAVSRILDDENLYQFYRKRSLKRASLYNAEKVMKRWDKLIEHI